MRRPPTAPGRTAPLRAAVASALALTALASGAMPAPADAAGSSIQAERLSIDGRGATVVRYSAAHGGAALRFDRPTRAGATVRLGRRSRLAVRARGVACAGAPRIRVRVDGRRVITRAVRSPRWMILRTATAVPAGSHRVTIAYLGDHRTRLCDRRVVVDSLRFETAASIANPGATSAPEPSDGPATTRSDGSRKRPAGTSTDAPASSPDLSGTGTNLRANVFSSDLRDGSFSEFPGRIHPERISIVDDPAGSARKVLRFQVHNSDTGPTENPRAQLETPYDFREGDDRYAGFSYRFPADFPTLLPSQGWVTLGSIAYGPPFDGAGPVTLRVQNRVGGGGAEIRWQRNDTYDYDIPWSGPRIADLKGGWVDIVIRVKLSRDPAVGFVELWMNTGSGWIQQKLMGQNRLYMKTYDSSNGGGANNSRLGLYYRADIPGPLTMYHGGLKVASAGPDAFASVAPDSFR